MYIYKNLHISQQVMCDNNLPIKYTHLHMHAQDSRWCAAHPEMQLY